jgi:hypothetical protein
MTIQDWSYDKDNKIWAYLLGPGLVILSPRDGKYVAFYEGVVITEPGHDGRFDDEQAALKAVADHAEKIRWELEGLAS